MAQPRWLGLWGLLVAAAAGALYGLGSIGYPLAEPDEARYGEVARAMLVGGDWVTPHLNFQPYFHKPPLLFWLSATSFAQFGVSELAGRLPVVLTGLLTLAMIALLARRMYGASEAVIAAAIAACAPLFALLAQILSPNMPLACFLTVALGAVWLAEQSSGRAWWRVAYASTALAVLAKGPVAVVLVLGPAGLSSSPAAAGAACCGPSTGPGSPSRCCWRSLVRPDELAQPRLPAFLRRRAAPRPLPLEHGAFAALVGIPRRRSACCRGACAAARLARARAAVDPRGWAAPTRYLVLWVALIMGFALSSSKLVTYALPAVPPAAILLARFLCLALRAGRREGLRRIAPLTILAGLAMSLCAAILPLLISHWRMPLIAPYLFAGGLVLAAGGWAVRRAVAAPRPWAGLAAFAITAFALMAVAVAGRGLANDSRALALAARAAAAPGDRVAVFHADLYGMNFYTGRPYVVVGRQSGPSPYGGPVDPTLRWPTTDDLRRAWAGPTRLFLVIGPRELERLSPPLDPPPIPLARTPKKLLVVNRPAALAPP
ncbi:MAG: glycosyltransferase family 39 protein [Candidatus Binatia bacterium]